MTADSYFADFDWAKCIDPSIPAGCMRVDGVIGPAPTPGTDEGEFAETWRVLFDRERLVNHGED
jgi:hypothetical protein